MDKLKFVDIEIKEKIAIVTLNRPPVNALSMGLYADIASAFTNINSMKDVNVVILTGGGKHFCAGRDLKAADTDEPEERSARVKAAFEALYHCAVPVIAAVNGTAVGAGFALVTNCDFIIASEAAVFGMPEIDAGVNPSIATARRALNEFQARRLGFTGERISPQELYRLGAAYKVVPPDQLMPEAMKLAKVLAAKSPLIMRGTKWSANATEVLTDAGYAYRNIESRLTVNWFVSKDQHEGGKSIIEKRAPKFAGQ